MLEPKILFEDDDLIVCHKPSGIATQTRKLGQKDMESILRNHVALAGGKTGKGVLPYIGIVHRLDQPVEGVMVFAKNSQAAASLSTQVQKHSFGKKYYALVRLQETGKEEDGRTFSDVTHLPEQLTHINRRCFLHSGSVQNPAAEFFTGQPCQLCLFGQRFLLLRGQSEVHFRCSCFHKMAPFIAGVSGCFAPDKRYWDHEWDHNSLLVKTTPF